MSAVERLLAVMTRLRDPVRGCPWDVEQSFESIAPHTVEEAYEVDDAIRRGDMDGLREELGDLLLQVVFHAQMARERGLFDFDAVAEGLVDKLVRRHPHVFGDATVRDAADQTRAWEELKAAERAAKGDASGASALDGVARGLPALARAQKLWRRAARSRLAAGPPDAQAAFAARRAGGGEEALGALLFALCAEASDAGLDAERALREAVARFEAAARAREAEAPR